MEVICLQVWPGPVYYPDFHKQETEDWWVDECIAFKSRLDFAGLWIVCIC